MGYTTLDVELHRDWSVSLGAMLGDGYTHIFFLNMLLFQNVEVKENRNP